MKNLFKRVSCLIVLTAFCAAAGFAQQSDCQSLGLKGKVKQVVTSDRECVVFNEKGKVSAMKLGDHQAQVINYASGKLSKVKYAAQTVQEFQYISGMLAAVKTVGEDYSAYYEMFNYKSGLPTSVKIENNAYGISEQGICRVTYTKFDTNGNWTECQWTGKMKYKENGGTTPTERDYSRIITREISYY